jgi:hypothetical protein
MRLVMVPLVFSVACLAYVHRDKIIDQYTAAYPSDPAKAAAMQQCIEHNKNFNRLDADDRQACYRKYLPPTAISVVTSPVAAGPAAAPYYPYSPSHLPGNDIRRQEANDSYHPLIPSAQAEPLSPAAAPSPVPSPATAHPAQQHHHPTAARSATPAQ